MKVGNGEIDAASVILAIKNQIPPMSAAISTVFDHWTDLVCRDGRIPDRQTISPEAMSSALAHVWLCDFDAANDRFVYRLGGEHVISSLGHGVRGRYLDEITKPAVYPRVHAYFRKCVDLPAVLHVSGRIYAEQARIAIGERLMLPYRAGSVEVAGIIGAIFRRWSDQEPDADAETPNPTRRHIYFHLGTGAVEMEDVILS
jgi:hypothetical protein